jgi:hypothetical protein
MAEQACSVHECGKSVAARGLCWMHYKRLKRHGNAGITLRRYNLPLECRHCGATDAHSFYPAYRGICKNCKKRAAVLRRWSLIRAANPDPDARGVAARRSE